MIRFTVLGSLDIRAADGRQLRSVLSQPKRVALLAYLAGAGPGEFRRRDTLLGAFWRDVEDGRARHSLNQALYVLRRALGPEVVVSRGDDEIGIAERELWCDAVAFEQSVDEGRTSEALELYGGDLLEGFFISEAPDFEKWLDAERTRLRKKAAEAAFRLAERLESQGEPGRAAESARWAAELSLDEEPMVRRLVSLLDRVGDRASAVRAYEAFAERLQGELGLEPSPQTQELIETVRSRARTGEAPQPEPAPSPTPRPAVGQTASTPKDGYGEALRRAGAKVGAPTTAGAASPASIAVLPFLDMSPQGDQEYFSDGMAEELIASLAKVDGLRVAARTSSFQFKDPGGDIRSIGQQLNVSSVLEGSVRKSGDRVKVTVQLIHVADGFELWSEVYDGELSDIFAVQEEIARAVVDRLTVELLGKPDAPLVRRHTENLEAYTLYLKGRYVWNHRTSNELRAAIDHFEQAIEVDDSYALAYAGLADSYSILGWYRYLASKKSYEKIKWASEKAVELDPTLAEAYTSLAYAKFLFEWDWEGAELDFKRAIHLNPNYPTAHHWYAEFLMAMGRFDEALAGMSRGQALDPLSLIIATGVGWALFSLGRYEEAIDRYESILRIDADFVILPWFLGPAYVQSGRYEEAAAFYRDRIERHGEHPGLVALLAQAHALGGETDRAESIYAQLEERSRRAPIFPDYHALVLAALGETDQAFHWLDKAVEERCWVMTFLKVDPAYRTLHSDPRFPKLLEKIGLTD